MRTRPPVPLAAIAVVARSSLPRNCEPDRGAYAAAIGQAPTAQQAAVLAVPGAVLGLVNNAGPTLALIEKLTPEQQAEGLEQPAAAWALENNGERQAVQCLRAAATSPSRPTTSQAGLSACPRVTG